MPESLVLIFLLTELQNATTGGGENMAYKNIKLRGCDSAKIEQLIVTKSTKGAGTECDPYREVTQYWTLDGKLLFEDDQG